MGKIWQEITTGTVFGKLTVIGPSCCEQKNGRTYRYIPVKCDCDEQTEMNVLAQNLVRGGTKSCGCLRRDVLRALHTDHGMTDHPLHGVWTGLLNRCYNKNAPQYNYYGGRGITVDDCWKGKGKFPAFYAWAEQTGYQRGLHLHRNDNDAGYSPENCKWLTAKENNRAKDNNLAIQAFGSTKLLSEWVEEGNSAVGTSTVHYRINAGWSSEEALSIPPRTKRTIQKQEKAKNPRRGLDWEAIAMAPRPRHCDAKSVHLDLHYGYLTVIGEAVIWPAGNNGKHIIKVPTLCRCGNEIMVARCKLLDGTTKSCGCYKAALLAAYNTKHGGSSSNLYSRWQGMKNRCYNQNVINYPEYGGRGIRVCDEWRTDFASFQRWAQENGFSEEKEIHREDNNGYYSAENCQWVTPKVNQRNRSNNNQVTAWKKRKTVAEWTDDYRCQVPYGTLLYRLDNDWTPEDAISTSPGEKPTGWRMGSEQNEGLDSQ